MEGEEILGGCFFAIQGRFRHVSQEAQQVAGQFSASALAKKQTFKIRRVEVKGGPVAAYMLSGSPDLRPNAPIFRSWLLCLFFSWTLGRSFTARTEVIRRRK